MKLKKAIVLPLFGCLLAALAIVLLVVKPWADQSDQSELPVEYMEAMMAYDTTNLSEVVGFMDYVFVAKVMEGSEPWYKVFSTWINPESGKEETRFSLPRTPYLVQIIKNVKGELPVGETIEITKDGGVNEDQTFLLLFQADSMPKPGQIYLFTALTQSDGSLMVTGPGSNIPLTQADDPIVSEYEQAYRNEKHTLKVEPILCRYDPNYQGAALRETREAADGSPVLAEYHGHEVSHAVVDYRKKMGATGSEREIVDTILRGYMMVEEAEARGLAATQEEIDEMVEAPRQAYESGEMGENNALDEYCAGLGITIEDYFAQLREQAPETLAHAKLRDALAREYCEAHGLEYRLGAQPDEVNAAVEAELDKLFEEHKGEIVYY